MKRRKRVVLTAVGVAAAVGAVLLLTFGASRSEGPLSRILRNIGAGVSSAETRVVQRMRGAGRADALVWLRPYRENADRLRAPDHVLVGAYDGAMPASFAGVVALERALNTTLPLLHFYTAWGDKPEQQFPLRELGAIDAIGSIPVVTWEPWLVDFDSRLHPHLALREQRDPGGLSDIARGDYDFYIDAWAADAREYARPLMVRFGHEMNDPYRYPWGPQNNTAADYQDAWRRVVQRFRAAGAHNVVWVWAPHVAYAGYDAYYPGGEWVDWVGTGVLNFGTVARWSEWWTFEEIFGQKYPDLAGYGKPVMIAELGSLAVGGDRATWYREALGDLPDSQPLVKAVLFFNVANDVTITYQALDWTIASDSAVVRAVSGALAGWPPTGAATVP